METVHENDIVTGTVIRKIKGGLLVDIGVNVFLPASQVDIRRPADIGDYIGRDDPVHRPEDRRRAPQHRRQPPRADRRPSGPRRRRNCSSTLEVGQLRKGVVKNIAEFGAFVDLGGIDGLLHITDMSWGRIGHPSEMVNIDQEIEVQILHVDREKEKIALGLKQKTPSPWEHVERQISRRHRASRATVVNVMSYGAFVKLEEGIEGLVHISEMSWTKRISHPNELVHIDDEIEVVVLGINKEKQEISLGMKQTQANPWDKVADRYPPGTMVKGTVRNLTNYGAFIEIEEGIDGLLHVSDMSWTRKISHPSEVVEKGQTRRVQGAVGRSAAAADRPGTQAARRRSLGNRHPEQVSARARSSPARSRSSPISASSSAWKTGWKACCTFRSWPTTRSRIPKRSSRSARRSRSRFCEVDTDERKIGLSRKRVNWSEDESVEAVAGAAPSGSSSGQSNGGGGGPAVELRGGVGGESGPLIKPSA